MLCVNHDIVKEDMESLEFIITNIVNRKMTPEDIDIIRSEKIDISAIIFTDEDNDDSPVSLTSSEEGRDLLVSKKFIIDEVTNMLNIIIESDDECLDLFDSLESDDPMEPYDYLDYSDVVRRTN